MSAYTAGLYDATKINAWKLHHEKTIFRIIRGRFVHS
jgi:hypothetical protein